MSHPKNLRPEPVQSSEIGEKQYLAKKLEGYRAEAKGIPRQANWYSPVRPGGADEQGWHDGWDLARRDAHVPVHFSI